MQFAEFKGEENLDELVSRLYTFRGTGARVLRREAKEALLRANPHLKDVRKLPRGTLLVIPSMPGLKSAEQVKPVESSVGELVQEVRKTFVDFRRAVEAAQESRVEEARRSHQLLRSAKVRRQVDKSPVLRERYPGLVDAAKTRLKEAEAAQAERKKALGQLQRDLGRFVRRFR